jgi:hypothetical protein
MSGGSSYVPQSRLAKWFDARLPVPRLIQFMVFQTPPQPERLVHLLT